MGDEIDAMTDNILSTLFPPGKEFVGKEITTHTKKRTRRTLGCEFQRCFHLHFNADLITSNAIKEGNIKEQKVSLYYSL